MSGKHEPKKSQYKPPVDGLIKIGKNYHFFVFISVHAGIMVRLKQIKVLFVSDLHENCWGCS